MGKERTAEIETHALIDSRAGGTFIDEDFAKQHNIVGIPLKTQIRIFNANGTKNKIGKVTHYAPIKTRIGEQIIDTNIYISGLGKDKLIFGLPWLKKHNPKINWEKGSMDIGPLKKQQTVSEIFRKHIGISRIKLNTPRSPPPTVEEIIEIYPEEQPRNTPLEDWQPILEEMEPLDEANLLRTYTEEKEDPIWIQTKSTFSQELAQEAAEKDQKPKTVLPEYYQEYASVFDKATSERMPTRRPWVISMV